MVNHVEVNTKPHWASAYLTVPYIDGGRDMQGMDCWGLVRHVLHHQFGFPLLQSFGHVSADDKGHLTESFQQQVKVFEPTNAKLATVAAGFRGQLLIHIGICIEVGSKLVVLETSKKHGVKLTELRQFNRMYSRTEFYQYVSNT